MQSQPGKCMVEGVNAEGEADGGRGAIGDDERGCWIKHTHLEGERKEGDKGEGKKRQIQ